ncbi:MAG: hypothetical protein ABIZ49_10850 [Opitutaceae bacterium]
MRTELPAFHPDSDDRRDRRAVVFVAFAALIFASRAWLIETWGSAVPFLDQWSVDGDLYRAWIAGTLRASDLVAAHNEHRILLTRCADLLLFIFSGHWNPWAQLLLNAVLHTATAAIVAVTFWPALPKPNRAALIVGLAVIFTTTAGWQNALWGFQSQVYFTDLLATTAFVWLARSATGTLRTALGCCALALALFGNASGLLAALAALVVTALPGHPRPTWPRLIPLAAVVALGFVLRVSPAEHAPLHAKNISQFLGVAARCLSWPHVDSAWGWLAMQLPLVALYIRRWKTRTALAPAERFAVSLAAFAFLNALAIAYSRGAGLPELRPLSRYQDPIILGIAAQWFAAVRLAADFGTRARLACIVWSGFAAVGLLSLTSTNLSLNLPFKRAQDDAMVLHARRYLKTGDATAFSRDVSSGGIHPEPAAVMRVLDDPVLRPLLPSVLRGNHDARPWIVHQARWLTLASALGLALMLAFNTRKNSQRPHTSVPAPPAAD